MSNESEQYIKNNFEFVEELRKGLGNPNFEDEDRQYVLKIASSMTELLFKESNGNKKQVEERIPEVVVQLRESNFKITPHSVALQICFEETQRMRSYTLRSYLVLIEMKVLKPLLLACLIF